MVCGGRLLARVDPAVKIVWVESQLISGQADGWDLLSLRELQNLPWRKLQQFADFELR